MMIAPQLPPARRGRGRPPISADDAALTEMAELVRLGIARSTRDAARRAARAHYPLAPLRSTAVRLARKFTEREVTP
jgi:hypothetical protein